ncbi:MAG TPA: glycosyltransferase [Firmicutes bacterium]|nr:glycosyltransferase [Bacillota bacterium]
MRDGEGPLIGIVGYIAPLKGQEEFVRAAVRIIREFPRAKFFIAGDILFRRKNRRFFKKLKTISDEDPYLRGNLFFTGYYADIYLFMKSMDLIIQPSWIEGWGRTVCEAFSCNVPVICSSVGGIPEIIKFEPEKYLVPVKEINSIVEKSLMILRDRNLIKDSLEKNRDFSRTEFSIEKHYKEVQEVYNGI